MTLAQEVARRKATTLQNTHLDTWLAILEDIIDMPDIMMDNRGKS